LFEERFVPSLPDHRETPAKGKCCSHEQRSEQYPPVRLHKTQQ
jgi:hypothetical protein